MIWVRIRTEVDDLGTDSYRLRFAADPPSAKSVSLKSYPTYEFVGLVPGNDSISVRNSSLCISAPK
jgi:hypothetical protein